MFVLRHILCVLLVQALLSPTHAVAQSPADATYDFESYGELEAEITRIDALRADAEAGSPERLELSAQAITARNETRAFLRGWIESGTLPSEYIDYARQADLVLAENLLHLHVEADACATANALLGELSPMRESESEELREAYLSAVLAVEACSQRNALSLGAEPAERRGVSPGAATLVGVGAALAVTGTIWNFTLLDDRNEHRDLSASCALGMACNAQQVNALGTRITSAQGPILALVVGGALVAAGGATWWAVDQRHGDGRATTTASGRRTRLVPSVELSPRRTSATLNISFAGRR